VTIDKAYHRLQRITTLHSRGVITEDQAEQERLEVLVDLASAQFTAGRKEGVRRVAEVVNQM